MDMIAKAEWFSPRRFGWGLGIRKWQGAAYVLGIVAVVLLIGNLPMSGDLRVAALMLVSAVFVIDFLLVLPEVYAKLDEREQKHQLVAERNSTFVAAAFVLVYMAYTTAAMSARQATQAEMMTALGPMVALMLSMALVKGGTLLWLERKN